MIFHEAVALVAIFIFVQHRIVTMSVYLDCNHYIIINHCYVQKFYQF